MDKREKSAELVFSTAPVKPITDVNVNAVKPVFKKRDKTEVPIESMTDEEIADAIHFTEEFIEREEAKVEKMKRIQKALMVESSERLRTVAEESGIDPYQLEERRVVAYDGYYAFKRNNKHPN